MRSKMRWLLILLLCGGLWSGAAVAARAQSADDRALEALLAREWDHSMEQSPVEASRLGDRRWNDRWPDLRPAALEREHAHTLDVLKQIASIDRAHLSAANVLNYDLFKFNTQREADGYAFHGDLLQITPQEGIQQADQYADELRFDTVKDYEDWLTRLHTLPVLIDQTMALMKQGVVRHVMLPRVVEERVVGQIAAQVVKDPSASPFYQVFARMPSAISSADQTRIREAAKQVIAHDVIPAYARLQQFFQQTYLPACFSQVGIWQIPNGDLYYQWLARFHTTTDLTPQEIHQIGLREVARIHGEMQAVLKQVGFSGDLKAFFHFLRTDKRFYATTPEQLLMEYRAIAKRIDPRLVKLFRVLPRTPYGVEPIPANSAPDSPTAYYSGPAADGSRAGTFYANLYRPEVRPRWEMMALVLHESVPGHHLQISLAKEQTSLPAFRRNGGYTAYTEGWGLYAESLGNDMGLYDDPYSKFGELTFEMWRAVRLVVDTGMHALHWSRQRAIDYFLENTPRQEHDVVNEIDRYLAMPGQALAYKIGQLKILELRQRARRELGAAFDIKSFHDVVLRDGAVPLTVLEQKVNDWIARERAAH